MTNTSSKNCRQCSGTLLADKDYSFGGYSEIFIKTLRCPKCRWVCMAHTKEELELWETLERYVEPKTRAPRVGENMTITDNPRGVPSVIKPSKQKCNCGGCGDDCSCNTTSSNNGCGSCGDCKH